MPNTKSAEKRVRTQAKQAERNRSNRSRLKTAIKKVRTAGSPDLAGEALREAAAILDRAASRRLIHPNKAARLKSRLSRLTRSEGAAGGAAGAAGAGNA